MVKNTPAHTGIREKGSIPGLARSPGVGNDKQFQYSFILFYFFISWRLITLQYCSGFCHWSPLYRVK